MASERPMLGLNNRSVHRSLRSLFGTYDTLVGALCFNCDSPGLATRGHYFDFSIAAPFLVFCARSKFIGLWLPSLKLYWCEWKGRRWEAVSSKSTDCLELTMRYDT